MIHAIVLAAGRSRRMGAQKLLLPIGGQPTIARVVDALTCRLIDRIWVVIGLDGPRIQTALAGRDLNFVTNAEAEGDMLSSVRCGLRALPEPWEAGLVVPGDQPTLTSEVVSSLVRTFQAGRGGIAVPTYHGKRGHPTLIARRHLEEMLDQHDAVGLRGLLQAHPTDVVEVETDAPGVLDDMDRPEDYARIAQRFGM
jgi:molybdenum cofactor cytidylyltransferase